MPALLLIVNESNHHVLSASLCWHGNVSTFFVPLSLCLPHLIFSSAGSVSMEIINMIAFFVRLNQGQRAMLPIMLLNRHWHACIIGAPRLFEHVVISSNMTLDALTYLFSLSKGMPLQVGYLIQGSKNSRKKITHRVTDVIAQHSHRIRYLTLRCLDWRAVDIGALAQASWPIVCQVHVVGYGLLEHTHHLIFSAWEIDIFLDWARRYKAIAPSRIILYGGISCASQHELLHFIPKSNEDIVPSDIDIFHNPHNDPANLEILRMSCLEFAPHMAPMILMLSFYSFPSLKILSIHTQFHGISTGDTRTPWTQLAAKCPSVQTLTLPSSDEGTRLLSDISIWPGLTHLTFVRGRFAWDPFCKMVNNRHSAGIPLQRVQLCDWESAWQSDEVTSLRKLVDVVFVSNQGELELGIGNMIL